MANQTDNVNLAIEVRNTYGILDALMESGDYEEIRKHLYELRNNLKYLEKFDVSKEIPAQYVDDEEGLNTLISNAGYNKKFSCVHPPGEFRLRGIVSENLSAQETRDVSVEITGARLYLHRFNDSLIEEAEGYMEYLENLSED